ncbi:MAG: hypothetical protein ABIQ99_05955 [Thermoflexales bacterium]
MTQPVPTLADLRNALARVFGLDDIDVLCADIGINPDSVPRRDTIEARAQALCEYVLRNGRLTAMLEACKARLQNGPIDWATFAGVALPDPGVVASIAEGVNALAALARNPVALEAISGFRVDFENARAQIALLGAYKSLHELLQELEVRYPPLDADSRRAATDIGTWNTLIQSIPEISDIIDEVVAQAANRALGLAAALWLTQFTQARATLTAALESEDAAALNRGRADLKRALGRGPSQVNTRMVATVDVLLQSNMGARMAAAREQLMAVGVTEAELGGFIQSLSALVTLRERLQSIRDEHNGWQEVENQLSRIEDTLATDSSELEATWSDVSGLATQLMSGRTDDWATRLLKFGADLQTALTGHELSLARRLFAQFRSAASRRFRRVDDELVQICQELQDVGAALDTLLRAIG